jgi:hypothetical protein
VGCLRWMMMGRRVACANCSSAGGFIIKGARWSTTGPPELEVASAFASCGTEAATPVALE